MSEWVLLSTLITFAAVALKCATPFPCAELFPIIAEPPSQPTFALLKLSSMSFCCSQNSRCHLHETLALPVVIWEWRRKPSWLNRVHLSREPSSKLTWSQMAAAGLASVRAGMQQLRLSEAHQSCCSGGRIYFGPRSPELFQSDSS